MTYLIVSGHVYFDRLPAHRNSEVRSIALFEVLDEEPTGRQGRVGAPSMLVVVLRAESHIVDRGGMQAANDIVSL